MTEKTKKGIYHAISIAFIVGALAFSIFRFADVFFRFLSALKDLGTSFLYFFAEMFRGKLGSIAPTVIEIPPEALALFPYTWEEFCSLLELFWKLLWDKQNFFIYLGNVFIFLGVVGAAISPILLLIGIVWLVVWVVYGKAQPPTDETRGEDTVQLAAFKRFEARWITPIVTFVREYLCDFLNACAGYKVALILIWLYNLNVFTIVVEAVAFILYAVHGLNVLTIYTQLPKLLLDVIPAWQFLPTFVKVILGYSIFAAIRRANGMKKLRELEEKNKEFLKKHPGALFIVGKQRSKKTTMVTSMALSQAAIFRETAQKKMQKWRKRFPNFPWRNVEESVRRARKRGYIRNLPQCKEYVWELQRTKKQARRAQNATRNILKHLRKKHGYCGKTLLFGYEGDEPTYNDGLKISTIWDALEAYVQLFFIYTAPTSLIYGNYSIRCDEKKKTVGNLEEYDLDFFNRNPEDMQRDSQYCHILDWDMLRLEKIMVPNNPNKDALDFGVVAEMEIGKERGNQHTNEGKKKDDKDCNPKNDGYNNRIKMNGHIATVDYDNFFRELMDDQRPDSLNADSKNLCDVCQIKKTDQAPKNILHGFALEESLHAIATALYDKLEARMSYLKAENSLLMYLINKLYCPFDQWHEQTVNKFGVYKAQLKVWNGMDDELLTDNGTYYLFSAKDHAERFATDGIGSFFHEKGKKSPRGINDVQQYERKHMSFEEMMASNSHFYNTLSKWFEIEAMEKMKQERAEWLAEREKEKKTGNNSAA